MNIGQVLTTQDYAVNPADQIQSVLDKMAEFRLAELPIVEDGVFLGLVSDETLIDYPVAQHSLQQANISYQLTYLYDTQHIYDGVLFFRIHPISLMPVIDHQHNYLGSITPNLLTDRLSETMSLQLPGAIIVLEMGQRDNALSHIAHIVESDNAQILNSYIQVFPDSARLEVTIKINKVEISSIIAAFLRHDYRVKATYNDGSARDDAYDRYEQFMNYINM